jgi:S-DNA-T family DNA segregation ATPase FtsK/SpoIIIE
LFEELHTIIVERETLFRTRQIDSVAGLRLAHQRGEVPELIAPDVVILIDGLEPLREEFAHLDPLFCELVQRGPTFGLHVVLALTRWNELKANIQPLIGQRCELRINEPGESTIQRRAAEALRASGPGRVLTQDQLYAQIGLPLLEDVDDDGEIGDGVAQLAEQAAAAWSGPAAAPIRLLPDVLDPADLPDVTHQPEAVPFGLQQNDFKAVCFDPALDQHLMVFGDARSGKTTVLRGLARGFMERLSPAELVFAVIDPRGGLSGEIPDDYLGGQAGTVPEAQVLSAAVAGELTQRVADRGGTYPRVVILVDDYDIISAGAAQPLAPLLPYLPSARDLGLSVIVTRPVVGASRGLLDAALGALRDTGGSGLVMNGEQSEGMIFPKVFAEQFPPGRGKFVRRGTGARVIQVADFTAKEHQAA